MLVVGVCSIEMRDSATFSLTKKNFTSMRLEREVLSLMKYQFNQSEVSSLSAKLILIPC